jgi:vitamin B12 transporter
LLRRPKHKASLKATWRPIDRLSLSATVLYIGSQVDGNRSFSIQRLNTDAYFLVNVATEYDIGKGVTLFARADNLFDRHYQDPTGFQRPGFGFFAGARITFSGKVSTVGAKEADKETYSKESSK